ncbi:hypothetical protein XENOCAPTIV_015268 [Xenoophorus captivus]|uniref:Uncharacterized protein n=1 Tax=Xenoophorus captivus TaxID=1517983 RepID=A0ABV0RMK2_9TELE
MSCVTSERCRLTSDDTTNVLSTTLSSPLIIDMQRDGVRQDRTEGVEKYKQVNKQKQRKTYRAGDSDCEALRVFDVPFDLFHNEMAVSSFNVLSQESTARTDPREHPDMRLNSIRQ